MELLSNKRILLGVCGSIAAYKSAELIRQLRQAGAEVKVVMTQSATEFITPLTLQALSANPVRIELMDTVAESAMGHIELARWADVILVAPASADFIARLVYGKADDLLTAICAAADSMIALAPAMNVKMWQNPANQANIATLTQRKVLLIGPESGALACGEQGEGRMIDHEIILQKLAGLFETGVLQGVSVLVSAGPTREAIDPVRYLSNRSSGKMGFAIAKAAVEAGANVTLVSGPVVLQTPQRVNRVDVISALQMRDAIRAEAPEHDIFIAAAAVADFIPATFSHQKIKKETLKGEDSNFTLTLKPAADILQEISQIKQRPFLVGFAAETDSVAENGRAKLVRKHLDMIAVNDVSNHKAFDCEDNELLVLWAHGQRHLPLNSKIKLARNLIKLVAEQYLQERYAKHTT